MTIIEYLGGDNECDGGTLIVGKQYEVLWEGRGPATGTPCFQVNNEYGYNWYVKQSCCKVVDVIKRGTLEISWD